MMSTWRNTPCLQRSSGPHRFHHATPLLHHRRPTTTTTTSPPSWLSPHRHVTRSRPPRFSQRAAPHSVLVLSPTRVAPRSVYPSKPTWATLSLSCVGSAGVGMVEEGAERLKRCSNGLSAPSSRHAHPTRALHVACIPHRDPSRSLRVPGMPHTQAPAMPDVA